MADQAGTEEGPGTAATGSRRNSALVGSGILVSRITGLARERALGHFLGTSLAADAFTAAFRVPNMLQHLLGEGVLSASFIPVYSRLLAEGREEEAGRVAGAVLGLLAMVAGALVVVGVAFAEPLTLVVAAGFRSRPEAFALTVRLVRILFPAIGFLVLSAWCLGVLNSHRRFFLSYVAPAALNVVQVAVLVVAGVWVLDVGAAGEGALPGEQATLATWLAVGTVAGGLLQFVVQLPAVLRVTRGLRPSLRTDLDGVRTTLRNFAPVAGARGVVQLSNFVHVFLASFLAVGALAALRYSQILYGLPIALFGMSVAAAELPELSSEDPGQRELLARRLDHGLARIAAFVAPTVAGYLVVGDLITGALFRTGEFGRLDTIMVWVVLAGYAVGLLASTSSRLLQAALYGVGNARTPSRLAVVRVVTSALLGMLLMVQLDRVAVTLEGISLVGELPAFGPLPADERDAAGAPDIVRLGAAGLSIAGGLAAWLEYTLLRRAVHRDVGPTRLGGGQLARILGATVLASAAALAARPLAADLPPILAGIVAVVVVAGVYLPAAHWLGVEEVSAARSMLARFTGRRRG